MAKYHHTSEQERSRALTFLYVYGLNVFVVATLFSLSVRTLQRWWKDFVDTGKVERTARERQHRWPAYVEAFIRDELNADPGLFAEELLRKIQIAFPEVRNGSRTTLLRVLHDDMGISRKKMTRRANEARVGEVHEFFRELRLIYMFPEQLVFLDETSKDARSLYRAYGYARRGERAQCMHRFARGPRRSILAMLNVHGFMCWEMTAGTFTRNKFHAAVLKTFLPKLSPYPMPNSILVMDNAGIHRYPELEACLRMHHVRLIYLPPYCPQLNPIEYAFNVFKAFMLRYVHPELWCSCPEQCAEAAMRCSTSYDQVGLTPQLHLRIQDDPLIIRVHRWLPRLHPRDDPVQLLCRSRHFVFREMHWHAVTLRVTQMPLHC